MFLLVLIAVWTLLAPEEATLSSAIRWVYLHVAFTWAGSSIVNIAGLAGLLLLARPSSRIAGWIYPVEVVAIGLYAVGFSLSLLASWASWGGVLLQEPRVIGSAIILCVGLGVLITLRGLQQPRAIGLVAVAFMLILALEVSATRIIFHPENAIDTSDSTAIKTSFYGLTILALSLGVVLVLNLGPQKVGTQVESVKVRGSESRD